MLPYTLIKEANFSLAARAIAFVVNIALNLVLIPTAGLVGSVIAGITALLALLFALPNLMTLSVVFGGSSAAHAGERIMDVKAPGFRGASLVGAIIAALVFVGVVVLTIQYRRRGRQLAKARAQ